MMQTKHKELAISRSNLKQTSKKKKKVIRQTQTRKSKGIIELNDADLGKQREHIIGLKVGVDKMHNQDT